MAKNVGFRFHPTNEELVNYYLKKKIFDRDFSVSRIKELDIYKFEPWDLPLEFPSQSNDKTWYCYCLPSRYANSKTTSRKTRAGYWKITTKDRVIKTKSGRKKVIGLKKTLTFYKRSKESKRGKGPKNKDIKTEWVMHEYHYHDIPVDKKSYVLCRIKIKPNNHRASTNEDSSSQLLTSNIRSEVLDNPHLEVGPSLVTQSNILNDVIGIQHDLSSVDQSLILSQPVTFNNMYVDTSSPGEVQSSDHSLASNFENDGSSHFLSQVDRLSFSGSLDSQFCPLQESSMDNFISNYDEFQPCLTSYCGDHAAENNGLEGVLLVDGGLEACDGYNGLDHNIFPAQQPSIRTELESSNVVGFTADHSSNSHFDNQLEQVNDLTMPLWPPFSQDPIDTDPPSIDSLYTKNRVYIGDNSNTDTETPSPRVKEYPPLDIGEYYSLNPLSISIWDYSYYH